MAIDWPATNYYTAKNRVKYAAWAHTQPLSKGGYIIVEGGVRPLIVYYDNSYGCGVIKPP